MKESQSKKKDTIEEIEVEESLREKIIRILEIDDIERQQGGLCKVYDLGVIDSKIVVPGLTKSMRMFEFQKREIMIQAKQKLKIDLGEEYKKLSFEIYMKKPKYGATGDQQKFKVEFIVYGPDFPKLIRKVGKNKNIKIIE